MIEQYRSTINWLRAAIIREDTENAFSAAKRLIPIREQFRIEEQQPVLCYQADVDTAFSMHGDIDSSALRGARRDRRLDPSIHRGLWYRPQPPGRLGSSGHRSADEPLCPCDQAGVADPRFAGFCSGDPGAENLMQQLFKLSLHRVLMCRSFLEPPSGFPGSVVVFALLIAA